MLDCRPWCDLKYPHNWSETETKQFQNCFKLFCFSFISTVPTVLHFRTSCVQFAPTSTTAFSMHVLLSFQIISAVNGAWTHPPTMSSIPPPPTYRMAQKCAPHTNYECIVLYGIKTWHWDWIIFQQTNVSNVHYNISLNKWVIQLWRLLMCVTSNAALWVIKCDWCQRYLLASVVLAFYEIRSY